MSRLATSIAIRLVVLSVLLAISAGLYVAWNTTPSMERPSVVPVQILNE